MGHDVAPGLFNGRRHHDQPSKTAIPSCRLCRGLLPGIFVLVVDLDPSKQPAQGGIIHKDNLRAIQNDESVPSVFGTKISRPF